MISKVLLLLDDGVALNVLGHIVFDHPTFTVVSESCGCKNLLSLAEYGDGVFTAKKEVLDGKVRSTPVSGFCGLLNLQADLVGCANALLDNLQNLGASSKIARIKKSRLFKVMNVSTMVVSIMVKDWYVLNHLIIMGCIDEISFTKCWVIDALSWNQKLLGHHSEWYAPCCHESWPEGS